MSKARRVAIMLELEWPFKRHTAIFTGAQRYADEQGWLTIVDEYADDTLPTTRTKPIPYDGVLARATRKLAKRSALLRIPVVNVWYGSPARELPLVYTDLAAAGRMRAEHLLARGFRRFACLGFRNNRADAVESAAFRDTVANDGYACETAKIPIHFTHTLRNWRQTERVIAAWMDKWQPPIGVFVGPDQIFRLIVQQCRERNWRIPEDVAIVAAYNEETLCEQSRPTVTSVEMGYDRVGYEAARLLDQLMDGKRPPRKPILLPPVGVVARASTDFHSVDDELVADALRFISLHSHKYIGVADVAAAVNVVPQTLQRHFREHLSRSVAAEIRRVRLERAKRQLAYGELSVYAIARATGYGETKRMSEVFQRELGMSPTQFRKRCNTDRK